MRNNKTLIRNIQASMESAAEHIENGNADAALDLIREVERACDAEYQVLCDAEKIQ